MGSPHWEMDRKDDERRHKVCVNSFQIGKNEVTVGEFRKFVQATGYLTQAETNSVQPGSWSYSNREDKWAFHLGHYWDHAGFSQNDQHPVVCVSWNDVQNYIAWLNQNSMGGYRLPTEAEWEFAARAGTQSIYYWGCKMDNKACCYHSVNDRNCSVYFACDECYEYTAEVGSYPANDFGLYDMSGNVWEWTCSKYDEDYTGGETHIVSKNCANNNDMFVLRGGSFSLERQDLRVAKRNWSRSWVRTADSGFRLARTLG